MILAKAQAIRLIFVEGLMAMKSESVDAAAMNVGLKTTFAGAGTGTAGWLASSEGVAIVGVICALAGLAVQLVFTIRRDRRESNEHAMKMAQLRKRAHDA